MFAPVGYAYFDEIIETIKDAVLAAFPYTLDLPVDALRDLHARMSRFAINEFAAKCPSLSVASTGGAIFRVPGLILALSNEQTEDIIGSP